MPRRIKFGFRPKLGLDATVMETHDHAMTGSRLILARVEGPPRSGWTACWMAPWQRTLPQTAYCMGERAARRAFDAMAAKPPPVVPHLRHDWQREKFYRWESNFLKGSATLTAEQMKDVVRRVSDDFNMVAPSVNFSKARPGSTTLGYYLSDRHHIEMHDCRLHYVLHELGHAVDNKVNGNKLADHGPSFVRTAMTLIARYAFQSQPKMDRFAQSTGLYVAPASAVPAACVKPA